MRLITIRVGGFNEGTEVEINVKYFLDNDSDLFFCFNSLAEGLACLVMKTYYVCTDNWMKTGEMNQKTI